MVTRAAHTDCAMPGYGAHLRFTGLEPAVGWRQLYQQTTPPSLPAVTSVAFIPIPNYAA